MAEVLRDGNLPIVCKSDEQRDGARKIKEITEIEIVECEQYWDRK